MCSHSWMAARKESFLGDFFIGWECERCGVKVEKKDLTPIGFGGEMSTKVKVYGRFGIDYQLVDTTSSTEFNLHIGGNNE